MSRVRRVRRRRVARRKTNWPLIIGGVVVGIVVVFGLLYLALRGQGAAILLSDYCDANPERCAAEGPADAPVTVVEVLDYGCSACRLFQTETAPRLFESYVDSGEVRWLTVPYALGGDSLMAASGGLCALEQDAHREYTTEMYDRYGTSGNLSQEGILAAAEAAGVEDMEAFGQCLDSGRNDNVVRSNIRAAGQAGVNSTPTFYVNGTELVGARPFDSFQQSIELALTS